MWLFGGRERRREREEVRKLGSEIITIMISKCVVGDSNLPIAAVIQALHREKFFDSRRKSTMKWEGSLSLARIDPSFHDMRECSVDYS
jgi:hypothetical protein